MFNKRRKGSAAWLTEPLYEFGGTTEDNVFGTMMRMRLVMNSPGTEQAPPRGSTPCCGIKGIFQTLACGQELYDKGKHDMIWGMGFTESRHNKVRYWLANNIRELEGPRSTWKKRWTPHL